MTNKEFADEFFVKALNNCQHRSFLTLFHSLVCCSTLSSSFTDFGGESKHILEKIHHTLGNKCLCATLEFTNRIVALSCYSCLQRAIGGI